MSGNHISLILIPTLRCNADCEYCFENKSSETLGTEELRIILEKMADYMDDSQSGNMTVFWQGGEVFTLSPEWFKIADNMVQEISRSRNKNIVNRVQSNMIGYNDNWRPVIARMFGNRVGSSLDFPNVHRKVAHGKPETYNDTWFERVSEARRAGIHVGVISLPNNGTLSVGAQRFYSYFVHEIGLRTFQINTPFPGGRVNAAKDELPLDPYKLGAFLTDLMDVWMEQGYEAGISIGPFRSLLNYFLFDTRGLPCTWHANCTDGFICIDARGYVSQCDCWVASYPEYRFGNILDSVSMAEIMESEPRRRIKSRPSALIKTGDCIECHYLGLCHGGCPIRAFSSNGDLFSKDPYCEAYKAVFRHAEQHAFRLARNGKAPRK